ncbi:NAD(P)-dependent alcohol dehydrogenase [Ferdinandcohnia sp. Marseille-Q9671]
MKAIVSDKYGTPDSLQLKMIQKPIPKDDQVLIKIHAASINYGNLVLLKGKPYLARLAFGLFKPKFAIPGGDMAGTVEAVGKNVTQFQPGAEVFGDLSSYGWGAFSEYVAVPEKALVGKPSNLSFEEAASVPMAAVTALQAMRDVGKLKFGQKVLIHGASGGVGTFAVQLAKAFGAEVTAVVSTRNVHIAQSIGADKVVDYTSECIRDHVQRYDLILGVNGSEAISTYKRLLNDHGRFIHVGGAGSQLFRTMLVGPMVSINGSKKMSAFLQRSNQEDLLFLKELIEAGKVKPVIDKQFPLSKVPAAFSYFEEGHAQGKVVITL